LEVGNLEVAIECASNFQLGSSITPWAPFHFQLRRSTAIRACDRPPAQPGHTFDNGDVLLQPRPQEDIVIPPLKPGTKPGLGEPPLGYHVVPPGRRLTADEQAPLLDAPTPAEWHRLMATFNRNAWA
jgi:hypothetical protein